MIEEDRTDEKVTRPLSQTTQDATDKLLARVRGLPGRRKLRLLLFPSAIFVAFIVWMVCIVSSDSDMGRVALGVLTLSVAMIICLWTLIERREQRNIRDLAACREVRTLGVLLECVNGTNRGGREAIYNTLLELFPQVTEEDSAVLNTGDREVLNALLYDKSGELAMAALFAIEQVGDGTALPYLTSIAAGKGVPKELRSRQAEVQARAQYTVERINERIAKQNRANVLLRPSQIPGTPVEHLVRPADHRPRGNAQELLRPETALEAMPNGEEKEKNL